MEPIASNFNVCYAGLLQLTQLSPQEDQNLSPIKIEGNLVLTTGLKT